MSKFKWIRIKSLGKIVYNFCFGRLVLELKSAEKSGNFELRLKRYKEFHEESLKVSVCSFNIDISYSEWNSNDPKNYHSLFQITKNDLICVLAFLEMVRQLNAL